MSSIHISRINRGWVLRGHGRVSRDDFNSAITQVKHAGGGTVRCFICESTADERSLAASHGLKQSAPLLHMRCALPLATRHRAPDGFVTRAFRPGIDDAEWLAVNSRAFAAHPEQGDWTHEVLSSRIAEPWFDAAGFLIYEVAGRIAGFCWTKVHESGHGHVHGESTIDASVPAGEIYVIGVDPAQHGTGLGRALTIAGFAHLAARGLHHGLLYVAGDNAAAIRLYESLGMTVAHHDDVFIGVVAAR
ncbi:MAG: mycothiol synthase [Actinomycetota bacterium]